MAYDDDAEVARILYFVKYYDVFLKWSKELELMPTPDMLLRRLRMEYAKDVAKAVMKESPFLRYLKEKS